MKVLVVVNPMTSIFRYLVPFASALRTAGHQVHVASQPSFASEITAAGLAAVPLGRDLGQWWLDRDLGDIESSRQGIPPPWDFYDQPAKRTWEYVHSAMNDAVTGDLRMSSFPIIGDVVDYARFWQPDLVVWDALSYAGPIAAKACGAANARYLFGIDVHGAARQQFRTLYQAQPADQRHDPLAEWLGSYATKFGTDYTEDMAVGHFTIDPFPESLQVRAPGLTYLRMQYVPYGGPSVIPRWLQSPPTRPRVALTLGLSATDVYSGYNVSLAEIIDSVCELDVELVATVADSERHKVPDPPPNARLLPYVPMHALVPTCSAVIHHAGAATLATAALHPVPHLALHYHYDQPILAGKLADHGAGLAIPTTEATGAKVRDSVQRLLTEPAFTDRAESLRDEITGLPTPNQIVAEVEELTAVHRT